MMRAGSSGVSQTSADIAMIAVTTTSNYSPADVTDSFSAAGFTAVSSPQFSQTQRDHVAVISVVRTLTSTSTRASLLAASITAGAYAVLTIRYAGFQPVWHLTTWASLGIELLVMNDDDATEQLDALSVGLGIPRSTINIKPRTGWQGYGYPEIQASG